ncbi:hypothetical protein CPC08DRAFT_120334 [Agrocybe pediades]|nr:hypothetical protein CPC08DRAFT_120334 [Agrocybe pediades]
MHDPSQSSGYASIDDYSDDIISNSWATSSTSTHHNFATGFANSLLLSPTILRTNINISLVTPNVPSLAKYPPPPPLVYLRRAQADHEHMHPPKRRRWGGGVCSYDSHTQISAYHDFGFAALNGGCFGLFSSNEALAVLSSTPPPEMGHSGVSSVDFVDVHGEENDEGEANGKTERMFKWTYRRSLMLPLRYRRKRTGRRRRPCRNQSCRKCKHPKLLYHLPWWRRRN